MANKFFEEQPKKKHKKINKSVDNYDASIFTSGMGYDSSFGPQVEDEEVYQENNEYEDENVNEVVENNYSSAPSYDDLLAKQKKDEGPDFVSVTETKKEEEKAPKEIEQENNDDELNNAFLTPEKAIKGEAIKNPVYVSQEEVVVDAKVNLFIVIGMLIKAFFKPGTSVVEAVKKYKDTKKAAKITAYITVLIILLSLGIHVLTGGFKKMYDLNTGSYTTVVDFTNIWQQDYLSIIVGALSISCILILVVSAVYYILSFMKNKGVYLGTYIMVSNLALFPFLFTVAVLYPVGIIISYYIGFLLVLISLVFASLSFYTTISEVVPFKDANEKIFYNVFSISIVLILLILVIVLFFANDFNEIMNLIGTYF